MKATKQNKYPPLPFYTCCKDGRPCPTTSQYQLGAPVTRVDNVSYSHVIFMIRDTDIRKEIPSLQVRILPRVPHRNNRAKTVKAVTTHWFLVLFACFVFSWTSAVYIITQETLVFVVILETYPFISESKNDKTDQKMLSQTVESFWFLASETTKPTLFTTFHSNVLLRR